MIKIFFTTKIKTCLVNRTYGMNFITYGMNFITLESLKNVQILGYFGIKNVISLKILNLLSILLPWVFHKNTSGANGIKSWNITSLWFSTNVTAVNTWLLSCYVDISVLRNYSPKCWGEQIEMAIYWITNRKKTKEKMVIFNWIFVA